MKRRIFALFAAGLVIGFCFACFGPSASIPHALAASNVTVGDFGSEFTCDGVQALCTLNGSLGGGVVKNTGTVTAVVNFEHGVCSLTQPVGNGQRWLTAGQQAVIPTTCNSFTFVSTGGQTFLQVSRGVYGQP